jgi:predicted small secreted protein
MGEMMRTQLLKVLLLCLAIGSGLVLAACSNTIRGAGQDVSNTVQASEQAVQDVAQ